MKYRTWWWNKHNPTRTVTGLSIQAQVDFWLWFWKQDAITDALAISPTRWRAIDEREAELIAFTLKTTTPAAVT